MAVHGVVPSPKDSARTAFLRRRSLVLAVLFVLIGGSVSYGGEADETPDLALGFAWRTPVRRLDIGPLDLRVPGGVRWEGPSTLTLVDDSRIPLTCRVRAGARTVKYRLRSVGHALPRVRAGFRIRRGEAELRRFRLRLREGHGKKSKLKGGTGIRRLGDTDPAPNGAFLTPLGFPEGSTVTMGIAVGVTADGRMIVAGHADPHLSGSLQEVRPILVRLSPVGEFLEGLLLPGPVGTEFGAATAVSEDGRRVGGVLCTPEVPPDALVGRAAIWNLDANDRPVLSLSDLPESACSAVGSDGGWVGRFRDRPVHVSPDGSWRYLPTPDSESGSGVAAALSCSGTIVGYTLSWKAVLWDEVGIPLVLTVPHPPDTGTGLGAAQCISPGGEWIGGIRVSPVDALLWMLESGEYVPRFVPAPGGNARGGVGFVSDAGLTLGGVNASTLEDSTAFIWTPGWEQASSLQDYLTQQLSVDLGHWRGLENVAAGQVTEDAIWFVGWGENLHGEREAFAGRIPLPID
jgi:hypothetical protein